MILFIVSYKFERLGVFVSGANSITGKLEWYGNFVPYMKYRNFVPHMNYNEPETEWFEIELQDDSGNTTFLSLDQDQLQELIHSN